MDKGWGLALHDSKSISLFSTKPPPPSPLHSFLDFDRSKMFHGIQFPVKLGRTEDDVSPPPPSDEDDRRVLDEVDFFSDKKTVLDNRDNGSRAIDTARSVKTEKDNSHGEAPRPLSDLNVNTRLHLLTANTGSDESTVDDGVTSEGEEKIRARNELAQLQVELQRMNSENEKLKLMLSQVSSNYSTLQMHLLALMQQRQNQVAEPSHQHREIAEGRLSDEKNGSGREVVPRQFMDLGPSGTAEVDELSHSSSDERTRSGSPLNKAAKNNETGQENSNNFSGKRREESPESESQGWGPNKVPKLNSPNKPIDQSSEATMRKARVSVRARSEAPMITDGCQWRKYGQKMAKGNPCPRAYYRCTMAVGCPVRKQVQRCAEDRTILITTYEGSHNHPLPPAAMAMASTTTAAASMLLSGSMSSGDGLMNPNVLARAILPCSSSMATISASAPFPTVTLDLTHSPNPLQFQRSTTTQFQVPFLGHPQHFASAPPTHHLSQALNQTLYNQSKFSGLQLSNEMGSSIFAHQGQQPLPPSFADTLSAATAAITSDPNFTAALAAAISSIIGGGAQPNNNGTTNTNGNANTTTSNSNNSSKISSFPGN